MKSQVYAVIMAGGSGTRFWPKSRNRLPKQFLKIIGDKTMIQHTAHRIESLVPPENILIVANISHRKLVSEQLSFIPSANVILEPVGRNTAPCIGYAALVVQQRNPDGVMLVLPSDHWIKDDKQFCNELKIAATRAAEKETLILFGIKPTYPETGYGYIKCDKKNSLISEHEIYPIEKFMEKPDLEQARQFIENGNFFWNAGTFVWKASTISEEIEKYLPELHKGLMKIKIILETNKEVIVQHDEENLPLIPLPPLQRGDLISSPCKGGKGGFSRRGNGVVKNKSFPKHIEQLHKNQEKIKEIFQTLHPESIDYGVMEKTKRAEIIVSHIGWSDIGSWKALENHLQLDTSGSITSKKHLLIDTHGSIIEGNDRLIAVIGLKDMIVVDTEDVLLICPKDRCQEVKKLVERLKEEGKDEYL